MPPHKIHLLPRSLPPPQSHSLLTSHKSLRLHALQTSPESFSSTYDREAAFSDSDWAARLLNPLAFSFVAAAASGTVRENGKESENAIEELLHASWIGMAILYGPATQDPPVATDSTLAFELFGLFVMPGARGSGVGKALLQAAVAHAQGLGWNSGAKEVRVCVDVKAGNGRVLGLYSELGFAEMGEGATTGDGKDPGTVRLLWRCEAG